jgi:hypothetical protein
MVDLEVGITIEAGLQEETITEVDHLEVEITTGVNLLGGITEVDPLEDITEADPRVGDVVDVLDDYYCSFKLRLQICQPFLKFIKV